MKKLFTLLILMLAWAGSSWGQQSSVTLSNYSDKKVVKNVKSLPSKPLPLDILQGGDNIASATEITALPYSDIGTTIGYTDDYEGNCELGISTAPDVVYSYIPSVDQILIISLCNDGTDYDTKLFVFDVPNPLTGDEIACSDDACSTILFPDPYVSEISSVAVTAGTTYYIVVDGYFTYSGAYEITVEESPYPVPLNDECTSATLVNGPFPQTVNGTTLGATVDCPGVLDWNAVWYAVELPYAINDLIVDWCGTESMASVGVVYYEACPVSCIYYVLSSSSIWQVCGTPIDATTALSTFQSIPGPATIYYPAYSIPQMDHVITFNVTEVICPDPTDPVADNITTTTANLTWIPGGIETDWEYVYGEAPLLPPGGPGIATNSSTVNPISGLSSETNYQFYVRANCDGDFSPWTSPASFYTGHCIPAPTSVDGLGITNVTFSTVNNPTVAEPGNYGDYSALVGDVPQTATIPVFITYETGVTYFTKIWIDWNDDLDFDDEGEEVYSGTSLEDVPTTLEASFTVPLAAPLGNHRMRIGGNDLVIPTPCYTGTWGSYEDYTVNVTPAPACLPPTAGAATSVLPFSADIGWAAGGLETAWEYYYGFSGDPGPVGPGITTIVNPTSLTGLVDNTAYQFWVRADCGGEYSDWAGPYPLFTPESCPPPDELYATDISTNSASIGWTSNANGTTWDVELGLTGFTVGAGQEEYYWADNEENPLDVTGLEDSKIYDFYVRENCGFQTPKIDYFYMAQNSAGELISSLSGGYTQTMEPGETLEWLYYDQVDPDWYNIWFYNEPYDNTRMKVIRMGFWIEKNNPVLPATFDYVVNWSKPDWVTPDPIPPTGGFPQPNQEMYIERSPAHDTPIGITGPQWVELYYTIPDYNPEWVSVDIFGNNIQILNELTAPPATSTLYYWYQLNPQRGGIIVHECLPKPIGDVSMWSGPFTFATDCPNATLPLCESFSTAIWPLCWTEQLTGVIFDNHWSIANSYIAGGTPFYEARAYFHPAQGVTQADNDRMVSPPFNTTGLPFIHVSFRQMLNDWTGGNVWLKVQSSSDGINWTDEWVHNAGAGNNIPAELKELDIYNNLGGTTWIAWTLSGNTQNINFWYVDDICITEPCLMNTWTGATSIFWNEPGNWSCGQVPDETMSIIIPSGLTTYPVIGAGVIAECFVISLGTGATFTVANGGELHVVTP